MKHFFKKKLFSVCEAKCCSICDGNFKSCLNKILTVVTRYRLSLTMLSLCGLRIGESTFSMFRKSKLTKENAEILFN